MATGSTSQPGSSSSSCRRRRIELDERRTAMPVIEVKLYDRRVTEESVPKMIEALTNALHETSGAAKEHINVIIQGVPPSHWGKGGKPGGGRTKPAPRGGSRGGGARKGPKKRKHPGLPAEPRGKGRKAGRGKNEARLAAGFVGEAGN